MIACNTHVRHFRDEIDCLCACYFICATFFKKQWQRVLAAAASSCERANSQFVAATTTTIYLPSMMIGLITVVEFHCGTGEIQWILLTCK